MVVLEQSMGQTVKNEAVNGRAIEWAIYIVSSWITTESMSCAPYLCNEQTLSSRPRLTFQEMHLLPSFARSIAHKALTSADGYSSSGGPPLWGYPTMTPWFCREYGMKATMPILGICFCMKWALEKRGKQGKPCSSFNEPIILGWFRTFAFSALRYTVEMIQVNGRCSPLTSPRIRVLSFTDRVRRQMTSKYFTLSLGSWIMVLHVPHHVIDQIIQDQVLKFIFLGSREIAQTV